MFRLWIKKSERKWLLEHSILEHTLLEHTLLELKIRSLLNFNSPPLVLSLSSKCDCAKIRQKSSERYKSSN